MVIPPRPPEPVASLGRYLVQCSCGWSKRVDYAENEETIKRMHKCGPGRVLTVIVPKVEADVTD